MISESLQRVVKHDYASLALFDSQTRKLRLQALTHSDSSPALKRVLQAVETVAPTDSTVLLRSETGTGKELLARAIHNLSSRREHTFVRLSAAALPATLIESELSAMRRAPSRERDHARDTPARQAR